MTKTPQEELETIIGNLYTNEAHISSLKDKLSKLSGENLELKKAFYDAWLGARKRVRLTKDAYISFFITPSIFNHFTIPCKNQKFDYSKMTFGRGFLCTLDRCWTDLTKKFFQYNSKCCMFDQEPFSAGKEFSVFKEIKKSTIIPYYLFSEDPLKQTDYNGKYSLVAFPFSEATKEHLVQIENTNLIRERFYHDQYRLQNKIRDNEITHIFLIIPNDFLEEIV